jgi:hypothetical protein
LRSQRLSLGLNDPQVYGQDQVIPNAENKLSLGLPSSAESAQLPMGDLLHLLHCLGWVITTRMSHHFGCYEFIPTHSDDHKRADLRRATGEAKKQL